MRFPNHPWPISKGKSTQKTTQWSQSKNVLTKTSKRHSPVAVPTDTLMSSSDSSYHSNNDVPQFHHQSEDTVANSNGLNTNATRSHVVKHDQLTRRPLHTYTPAGAGSVSVNGVAGIKVTYSHPSSQH